MLFKLGKRKDNSRNQNHPIESEDKGLTKTVKLYCYSVYCDKDDKLIDSIYLTENQANKLNNLLYKTSTKDQSIVLLKKVIK